MNQSTCRTCSQPIVWQDTDQGRRPFNVDGTPHRDARSSAPRGGGTTSPARERTITRLACLKAAATFCGGKAISNEVSSADVLKIAEAFERWVQKGDAHPI